MGSGVGLIASGAGAFAIGAGVEMGANAMTGEPIMGVDVVEAGVNNAAITVGGMGGGRVLEAGATAVARTGVQRLGSNLMKSGQVSPQAATSIVNASGSSGMSLAKTTTGEVFGYGAGAAATTAGTFEPPVEIAEEMLEKLKSH